MAAFGPRRRFAGYGGLNPVDEPINKPIPVLINAHAGALHGKTQGEQLERMARAEGFAVRTISTHSKREMETELGPLIDAKTPRVGIAGGDGTVEAAAQLLAHTQTALGILSQGTFNNFATALGIPHNLPAALRVLHKGMVKTVDLGQIGDKYFAESAGVGLFADGLALYGANANKNFWRGLWAGAALLLSFKAQTMILTIDGETITRRVTACEIANTYRIAQAMPLAPYADVSDGVLNVVVIGDIGRRDILSYLKAIRAQMHLDLPDVSFYEVRREITIETKGRKRNFHADDAKVGATPVTVRLAPGALRVLVQGASG